jgi:hypothetical protein
MGDCRFLSLSGWATRSARAAVEATATSRPKGRQPQKWQSRPPPTMMTNLVSRWPSAQRRRTQGRIDVESRRKSFATRLGRTMIRHALPSSTVPAASLGVHGAPPRSRLIASPGFPLSVAAGLLRAGSGAVDLASITDPTDKNLRAAADIRNILHEASSTHAAVHVRRVEGPRSAFVGSGKTQRSTPRAASRSDFGRGPAASQPPACVARANLWICGQRKGVAHIPTGAAAKASLNILSKKGQPPPSPAARPSNAIKGLHRLCADPGSHSQKSSFSTRKHPSLGVPSDNHLRHLALRRIECAGFWRPKVLQQGNGGPNVLPSHPEAPRQHWVGRV